MATTFSKRKFRNHCGPSLETLVFKLGGVSGAVRRIIYRASRPLTMPQIYRILEETHPLLHPAKNQIESTVQQMVERGRVTVSQNEKGVRTYKLAPRPAPTIAPAVKPAQLSFEMP